MNKLIKSCLIALVVAVMIPLSASATTCRSAKVFERMLTQICWSCLTPIRVSGMTIGGGDVPVLALNEPICTCDVVPGIGFGTWLPREIIEVVDEPGCSPTLQGIGLPMGVTLDTGHTDNSETGREGDVTYKNAHQFAFPVGEMMGIVGGCPIGASEIDLMLMSELIATWRDDVLSAVVYPETGIFANAKALAVCAVDATLTGFGGMAPPVENFFCAGAWGSVYPLVGNIPESSSEVDKHSLLATRLIAQSHRLMMSGRSVGNACHNPVAPTLQRDQYKMQHFWPSAQASDNHYIGESSWKWGPHRWSLTEDTLKILWRWEDCCFRPTQ